MSRKICRCVYKFEKYWSTISQEKRHVWFNYILQENDVWFIIWLVITWLHKTDDTSKIFDIRTYICILFDIFHIYITYRINIKYPNKAQHFFCNYTHVTPKTGDLYRNNTEKNIQLFSCTWSLRSFTRHWSRFKIWFVSCTILTHTHTYHLS